jgi:hypothetical protein
MTFAAYVNKVEAGVTSATTTVSVAAPAGVAASGFYQLCLLCISSSSTTLGTTPDGWGLLSAAGGDVVSSSTNPDRGGTQRIALFESTSATAAFGMTLGGSARIWAALRLLYSIPAGGGRTVALGKTLDATGVTSTAKTVPPLTAGAVDTLSIALGAADWVNSQAWEDTGVHTARSLHAAGTSAEWQYMAAGDRQIAANTANASGTLTLGPSGEEAGYYHVLLNGTAPAATGSRTRFFHTMAHHEPERPGELWTPPERRLHRPRRILDLAPARDRRLAAA